MDIEKTILFLIEHQARLDASLATFESQFKAGMEELRQSQRATERLINAFAKAGEAQIELHRARLDGLDQRLQADELRLQADEERFQAFLKRFDAFLQGQQGNGRGA
jgi:division protein CdvB (Snf7/Vps24/ESCRT-III family)